MTAALSTEIAFSVVVPTCRRPDLLVRCLRALAPDQQTIGAERYEVIVTDDFLEGSEREGLPEKFPWVRWTAGPRRGPAANRNQGASHARGAWVVFTDDDCVPTAGWLEAFAVSSAQPGASRVFEGCTRSGVSHFSPLQTAPENLHGGFLWSCNFAIQRALFLSLGGFDENFPFPHLEDVDLRLRLADMGEAMVFVPAAIVVHPPRPSGRIIAHVRKQESAYYLVQKRGPAAAPLPLLSQAYWRTRGKEQLRCRTLSEWLTVAARSAAEFALLALYTPFWLWRYRPTAGRIAATAHVAGSAS